MAAPVFPHVAFQPAQGSSHYLEYLLIHELGHVLGNKQGVDSEWSKLSWKDWATPEDGAGFKNQGKLPFYFADGNELPESEIGPTYDSLAQSEFPTTYGGADSLEDFAECFLLYALTQWRGGRLSVETAPNKSVDLMKHFSAPKMQEKRDFIARTLEREVSTPSA